MPTIHVLDYLAAPQGHQPRGICVLFGDEQFLKRLALAEIRKQTLGDKSEEPPTMHDCEERMPDWRDVADELSTHSLFGGGGPRLVLLEGADAFVSAHRDRLEDYIAKKKHSGLLVLEVSDWAANTRLYKAVDQSAMQIECKPPMFSRGKNKEIDENAVAAWVSKWGASEHKVQIPRDAAQLLVSLSGPNFGVLDMDLAKLALFVPAGKKATAELVQEVIGGWKTKSTWDLIDSAASGNAAEALAQLDRLLQSGEHPLALFGSISWSLRRYASATRAFQQAERRGERITIKEALTRVGVRDWPIGELKKAEERLMQLGRVRAGKIYRWLMETDLALKGSHSHADRARFVLEQLFLRMSKEAAPPAPKTAARR